ncbi:PAS domain-containing protein [Hymenobacter sp. BT559]|uniref:PAS domain-containing protein n=1 Tax=Hymenobacter sp. BT559 TaxID=2795729 RepID=UPI0018EC1D4F|nr:PAS domain-containing protein [Hymenobacter sp. BT559]MBJ6145550.1 PAS domain-containing protein [Hymenobacter sp. BT559]
MVATEAFPPDDFAAPGAMLQALLELSPLSVVLYKPVHAPEGEVIDFEFAYLNPAAQLLLQLPARPGGTTYRQHFPHSSENDGLALHQAAFASGRAAHFEVVYHVGDYDYQCQVATQRVGDELLVNITATATNEARPAVEEALRLSQAREQQARLAAEQERNLLQALLNQAPVAIGLFQGPDHVVAMANDQLCGMWGYPAAQVLHRPLLEAVPELQGQGFTELMADVARTGEPFVGTTVPAQLRQQGQVTTRFFDFVYQPLYDAAGQLLGVLDIAIDVTAQVLDREQVQALNEELSATNEELQTSNEELLLANRELTEAQLQLATERERLTQVFAKTPALIALLHGPHHTITYANPAFQQFFASGPLLGHAYAEALPKVHAQGHGAWLQQVYTTGKTAVGSERPLLLPTADGGERLVYLDFTYEAYGSPTPEGIFLFAFDVTERVLARRQRLAYQQLRAVFEQAPVAISILQGPDYQIEVANPFIIDMWGRTAEGVLNKPFFEVLPELREQGFEGVLAEVRRSGQPYVAQEVEARFWRAGKFETSYVNLSIYPLRDEQSEVVGLILVSTDVSTQLRARQREQEFNEELAVMNEELQSANDELGATNLRLTRTNVDLDNFIYTASHDLRAPITNIEGLLQVLQSELPAGQTNEVVYILGLMQDSVDRFKRTIEHLTEVSKLQKEHGQGATPVRLAEVIQNVQLDLVPLIKETGAQVAVDVPAFVTLTFSEKNLRSVVYNLLSNALKYRHPDRVPQVRLLSRTQGHHLVLEVQDNGLGLDLTRDHELFTMFQRYHTHVEGSGIGLYMVKKIVENAGGRIEVESQLGCGSTFFVYFPR